MKTKIKFIILLTILISCQINPTEQKKQFEKKGDKIIVEEVKNKNEKIINAILLREVGINYDSVTQKYISDTIIYQNYKYEVYGELYNTPDLNRYYFMLPIDSIKLIEPKVSILKGEGMGGYLYKKNKYNFEDIIKFNDVNGDNINDIIVYNLWRSGATGNSYYNVFLNQKEQFVPSKGITDTRFFINRDKKTKDN